MGCGGYCFANGDYVERHADVRVATRHSYCIHRSVLCVDLGIFFFYVRNQLIMKLKSRIGAVGLIFMPLGLICATGFCGYKYHELLVGSASYISVPLLDAEKTVSLEAIHDGGSILAYYILTMVFAESALFLMAIGEWGSQKSS